jgi:phosphomevalonate kinase
LLGDYAVVREGRALIAAVDRRATGVLGAEGAPSAVVAAVQRRAGRSDPLRIDTSAFHDPEGRKLGVGSSAAAAVVAAALLGRDHRGSRAELLSLAVEAHRDAAGGTGSGVDVAASLFGGVIAAPRQPGPVLELAPRIEGLSLFVLATGQSASTAGMVATVEASPGWPARARSMSALAEAGIAAWLAQDAAAYLDVVRRYGQAMLELGREAGVSIVDARLERLMERAAQEGGAAKPSGAGGGDVAIAFAPNPGLGARLAAECGFALVPIGVDPRGLEVFGLSSGA